MKLTHWRLADRFRTRREFAPPRDDAQESVIADTLIDHLPDPASLEDEWDHEWQQHLLAAASERLARQVNPLHFQVFDLHVLQQWPLLRVTKELRVSPASVYVISHRLKKRLRAEIEKLQKQLG
jgi:DNA-directed RNA polymerase specialized sigma24 family protein